MCDPLTIAGLALTAGSTVANTVAANQASKAQARTMQAERIRQSGLDREAEALNAQSQQRYTDFDDKEGAKQQELGEYLTGQSAAEPAASEAVPSTSSNITVMEEAKQRGKAKADTNASAQNLASLRSFGELMGTIGRGQARDASEIGQIGGFKRGSQSVLPFELEAAAQKGAGLRTLGDIMGGFGSIATGAGLSGASLGNLPGVGGLFGGPLNAAKLPTVTAKAGTAFAPAKTSGVSLGSLY